MTAAVTAAGPSARPLRLLLVGDADSVHVQRWVHEMAARGADCHLLTRRPAAVPGATLHVLRPGHDAAGWLLALPQVRRLAQRLAPDLVHGHYLTSNGLWAAACGRRPLVLTAWGSDLLLTPRRSRLAHALTGWIVRRADLLTGDSADLLAALRRHGARAPCELLTWGADTERFVPPAQPRDPGTFTLVSLRQWLPNYRIDVILDALALLQARRPQATLRLRLLGGGALGPRLHAQAQALGLLAPGAERVDFVGRVDDAGLVAALQAADVAISVPASDATSVALLESLACGCAVVVSDLPANRAWVDAQGGLRVPVGDAPALAAALEALWADRARTAAMGAHNRALALARASRRVQMDRMWALYRQLRERA
jgi:glycosyltransferase involved in cell wall biosynthesis